MECSGESPDCSIELKGEKIGVEITEFHSHTKGSKGHMRRAIEEEWDRLQKLIMSDVNKHNELQETYGWLRFKELNLPTRREYKDFIDELILFSLEMLRSNKKEASPSNKYKTLVYYLAEIHVEKVNCYITWDWNYTAGSVGLSEKELIDTVKGKLEKVSNYKLKPFDKLWLVIVSGFQISQSMGVRLTNKLNTFEQCNAFLKQSGYNNIYIYQYVFDVAYKFKKEGWIKIGKEKLTSIK